MCPDPGPFSTWDNTQATPAWTRQIYFLNTGKNDHISPWHPPSKAGCWNYTRDIKDTDSVPQRAFMSISSKVCKLFMVLLKINSQHLFHISLSISLFNPQHNPKCRYHFHPILETGRPRCKEGKWLWFCDLWETHIWPFISLQLNGSF